MSSYNAKVHHEQGGNRLVVDEGGELLLREAAVCESGVGELSSVAGLTVEEFGDGANHKTVFHFDEVVVSTTDNGTAGHGGGVKIYDFPQGLIAIQGVSQNWESFVVDGTGITNVGAVEIGVGTTIATSAMASLTGTAEDIVAGKTFTLSSSVSALHQFSGAGAATIDGSATAKDAYLNITCSVATADGDGTVTLTGTVTVCWTNVGAKSS